MASTRLREAVNLAAAIGHASGRLILDPAVHPRSGGSWPLIARIASIKPLYGRQEGAEIGYNPTQPMRPSHVLHTFLVSNLRLLLDVQVSSGKQHTSEHAKAAPGRLLDELGDKRPAGVRGDAGCGNEGILLTLEERKQPHLLRRRQTKNVQRLVPQQYTPQDWSRPCVFRSRRSKRGRGRLEAITSRPLMLAAVGKAASHANQTTLYLTPPHGRADILTRLIANIGAALRHVKAAAEQVKDLDRWACLLRYISHRIAPVVGRPQPPPGRPATG
jgi:hypothetical protein